MTDSLSNTTTATAARRTNRVELGLTLGYSTGSIVEGAVGSSLSVFLLFYLTSVCGVPSALAGAAGAAGLIVDAIADPMIGSMSDSWRSRWGRRLPFMAAALLPLTASLVLLFSLPDWENAVALFILLTTLSVVLRVSLSVFNLPYLAVGAELTDDYVERSRIMTWRWGISTVGTLAAVGLGFNLFFGGQDGLSNRDAYTQFALMLAFFVLMSAAFSMRAVHLARDRLHAAPQEPQRLVQRLLPELLEMFRNRSFRILFLAALLYFVAQGVSMSLSLHANTYFWRLDSEQVKSVTIAIFVGFILGAPLSIPIVGRLEKRSAVLISLAGLTLAQAGPASLRLLGLLPFEGQALMQFLTAVNTMGGMLVALASIALTSMLADAVDEHEYHFRARREGLYFASWAFAGKCASGLGTLIAGVLLDLIDFPVGQLKEGGLHPELPESMVNALGLWYGPGAALLSILGTLLLLGYRLDSWKHRSIITALHQRRGLPAQ